MTNAPTPHSDLRRNVLRGIGLMLLSVFIFAMANVFSKWALAVYPAGQLFFIRGFAALAAMFPFLAHNRFAALNNIPRPGLQTLRVVLSVADGMVYFTAVKFIPLVDASTCDLAAPIFVTALSAIVLRERVGWRRWTAVLVGFAGVIIALRPTGASFSPYALVALAGCLCSSVLMMVTRHVRGTPDVILAITQIGGSFAFGGLLSTLMWVPPTWAIVLMMLASGIVNVTGLFCANRALKLAPASVIAPFQYTAIIWAIVTGYLAFGDTPTAGTIIGALIITGAGIYIFLRERKVMHREPEPNPPPTV